jgi:hypothetical protein
MKTIKILVTLFAVSILTLNISSCNKCDGEDPAARIVNNGTETASVQIKTSGGNTENLNNVDPGTSSEYVTYSPGEIVFTISILQSELIDTVMMSECIDYDIVIDTNNSINTTSIER